MYVQVGHGGVRAESVSKLSGCSTSRESEREREKKQPQWAHMWIILANCVHFSLHLTLELSSKHKEEIKSPAAMLCY